MSRLEVPRKHRILWTTGDLVLWAQLDLLRKDDRGNWQPQTFEVDSRSDRTTLPAYDAAQMGLPMPQQPAKGLQHEQTGLEIRSGLIRCRVVGMDQTEYTFPCFFLGDPSTPPPPGTPPARMPRSLLGLSGVVDKIRWHFDGTPDGVHAPHGYLTVEKI
jgi:hypothetical protein